LLGIDDIICVAIHTTSEARSLDRLETGRCLSGLTLDAMIRTARGLAAPRAAPVDQHPRALAL
jgi:hypothetical protein